jgi:hypothetical protein
MHARQSNIARGCSTHDGECPAPAGRRRTLGTSRGIRHALASQGASSCGRLAPGGSRAGAAARSDAAARGAARGVAAPGGRAGAAGGPAAAGGWRAGVGIKLWVQRGGREQGGLSTPAPAAAASWLHMAHLSALRLRSLLLLRAGLSLSLSLSRPVSRSSPRLQQAARPGQLLELRRALGTASPQCQGQLHVQPAPAPLQACNTSQQAQPRQRTCSRGRRTACPARSRARPACSTSSSPSWLTPAPAAV